MTSLSPEAEARGAESAVAARQALLEGVGKEVAASFPGITRLGGQIVAALYLSAQLWVAQACLSAVQPR